MSVDKMAEPSKATSGLGQGPSLTYSSTVSPPSTNPLALVPEEEDPQDAHGMKRSLRQMGIRPPRPFDPKTDRNFKSLLNRIEFHFEVTKCPAEDKTGSLLLWLDVECIELAKLLGLKSTTDFDQAKAKLKNYFVITETSEELREQLDLWRQEAGESMESFACDVKLIGHRAYPKAANPIMLEHILIKQFTNGLNNELSRERVILKSPKTLTEAAQYARFSESAVRVARTHSAAPSTPSAVSSLGL